MSRSTAKILCLLGVSPRLLPNRLVPCMIYGMSDTNAVELGSADVCDATITATVKGLLKGKGYDNPDTLASHLGVTPQTIYNHYNGTSWKAWEVAAVATFFGIDVGRLYDGLGGLFLPDPFLRGGQRTLKPVPSPAKRRRSGRDVTTRYRASCQPPLMVLVSPAA